MVAAVDLPILLRLAERSRPARQRYSGEVALGERARVLFNGTSGLPAVFGGGLVVLVRVGHDSYVFEPGTLHPFSIRPVVPEPVIGWNVPPRVLRHALIDAPLAVGFAVLESKHMVPVSLGVSSIGVEVVGELS